MSVEANVVYFMQPYGGGGLKVGCTSRYALRMGSYKSWLPQGVEVLTTLPGDLSREEAIKWALRPYRMQGEWFRSCPETWRVVVEAIDTGDISWAPARPLEVREKGAGTRAISAIEDYFGGPLKAAEALGYAPKSWRAVKSYQSYGLSSVLWGRWVIEVARRQGRLPPFLASMPAELSAEAPATQGAAA